MASLKLACRIDAPDEINPGAVRSSNARELDGDQSSSRFDATATLGRVADAVPRGRIGQRETGSRGARDLARYAYPSRFASAESDCRKSGCAIAISAAARCLADLPRN